MAKTKKETLFTSESGRELQKLSAQKRSENTQKRKTMREDLKFLLGLALDKGELAGHEDILNLAEGSKKNISVQTAMDIAMVQRALLGDVQAWVAIRDSIGEKPSDKVEVDQNLTIESWAKKNKVKL